MTQQHSQSLTERIEQTFAQIHRERMAGLPILNPDLAVTLVGLRGWQGGWLGVLVTPWMMNLIALPGPGAVAGPGVPGSKRERTFPSGRYEFIAAADPWIGPHETCSLFSPMDAFADQEMAVATAQSILDLLFAPAATDGTGQVHPQAQPTANAAAQRTLSRRGLLRTALGRDA